MEKFIFTTNKTITTKIKNPVNAGISKAFHKVSDVLIPEI